MTRRPAVIEVVHELSTNTWHARQRAAGNRAVVWWTEDYSRKARAESAVELLPGFAFFDIMTGGAWFTGLDEPIELREVEETRPRRAR